MPKNKIIGESSPKAKNLSARLAAVQAAYQSLHNQQDVMDIYDQFIARGEFIEMEGEAMVEPDGALLKKVLTTLHERRNDLEVVIHANLRNNTKELDMLLKAILLCGSAELLGNPEVDAPIIINDYLNVTHSFYETGEVSLINGALDAIAKTLRS